MTLVNNIQSLATRIGQEIKTVRTEATAIADARYTKAEADAAIAAAIDAVVDGAPGALNTLLELSNALGGDGEFAASIAAQIASKADAAAVEAALALKANAAEVASALALKPNSSDVYTQSQTNAAIASATSGIALRSKVLNLEAPVAPSTTAVLNPAIAAIGTVNGYVVNLGFGNFDEAGPILIDNKWQLNIDGPPSASTTAVTVKNGLTIQNSNGVRITRVQFEGSSSIASRAGLGHHFEKVQFMGNLTLSGTGGFMMFTDCEFGGDIAIASNFAGVVYFIRCSFSKAAGAYNFGQPSPLQAIVVDSSGIPNSGFSKAAYSGMATYKNSSQAFFSNGVAISTAGAASGQVLKFNGTAFVPAADATPDVSKAYVDEALALKADSDDVGEALALKASSADVDAALGLKANASDVYSKSESDLLLAAKANAAEIGDLSTGYVTTFESALVGGSSSGDLEW